MSVFVHPTSDVQTKHLGDKTQVWQFCVVLPGAVIGQQVNICAHTFIENQVIIGDRVTVKCGAQLYDGVTLEDDVFVGPGVVFTNDRYPRSHNPDWQLLPTLVKQGASIGANATILPGVTIGPGAMIGAGSVVTTDVPAGGTVVGNPATVLPTHR